MFIIELMWHVTQLSACIRVQYGLTTVSRAASITRDECWCYEDGEDELVFSVDSPVQLLGLGLCGTDASYTAEVQVCEVGPPESGLADWLHCSKQVYLSAISRLKSNAALLTVYA